MIGMRVVTRKHYGASPMRLVRHFGTLPEPPSRSGPRRGQREPGLNFVAPVAPAPYTPQRSQQPNQPNQPPKPFFTPTKDNLETTVKELYENCEIYKYEGHHILEHNITQVYSDVVHRLLADNHLLKPDQAQALFDLAKSKNVATAKTYSILISYYAKRGDLETAKQVMSSAEEAKLEIEPLTLVQLVAAGIEKSDTAFAERIFRSVGNKGEQAFHAYRHMLRHYYFASRLNEFDAAFMELINNHVRIPTDPDARNFVLWLFRALHNLGRTAAISQLYREVRKTAMVLTPDMYTNVIRSLGNEESGELKQLVQDMKAKNIPFDSKLYYPLLRSLNRHETEYAKQLGAEMMASGAPMDMRTYNAYLHVCVRHRTPAATQDALRVYDRIKALGLKPDVLTYTNLIKACGQVSDFATCDTLIQDLQASGIPLTQEALSNIFPVVDPEVSFKILKALKGVGVTPDVIAYNMLLKRADPESAQQVLQLMEEDKVEKDAVTYNTLMGVYGKARNTLKCKELLQEMGEKGIVADVWAYNAMINALDIERPADALEWLREVRAKGCQPDEVTYNSLFTNLLRKTKESFVPLWEDMLKHDIKPSVYTYNLYVKARGQAGEVDACESLLHEMRTKELQPDVVTYTTCFDFISDKAALRRLRSEMLAQGVAPGVPSYVSLLRQCARNGDHAWADELLEDAKTRGLASGEAVKELKKLAKAPDGPMLVPEKLQEMYINGNIKKQ